MVVPFEIFDGYVLLNGAKAYIDNSLVYDKTISPDIFMPFLRELSEKNFKIAAEIEDVHYANFNVQEKRNWIENFVVTDYQNVPGSADKLYVVIEDPNQFDMITSILPGELYCYLSRDNLAMIMHKEATKYKGVKKIAQELHIDKSEIIAFGDDANDKELLLSLGFGVAMGNSIAEIKKAVDYVCDTNDNDGVARCLAENILEMKKDCSAKLKCRHYTARHSG